MQHNNNLVSKMNTLNKAPVWAINAKAKMNTLNLQYKDILHVFDVGTTDAIGHYFNGRREPSISSLLSLGELLHISNDDLFLDAEQLIEKQKINTSDHLMDALKILARLNQLSDSEAICLLNAVDKIGTKNIIEASNVLAEQHKKGLSRTDAVLDIQQYMKKAS